MEMFCGVGNGLVYALRVANGAFNFGYFNKISNYSRYNMHKINLTAIYGL